MIEGESEVFVDAGSTHTITCRVESPTPPHHIFWYFEGQVRHFQTLSETFEAFSDVQ